MFSLLFLCFISVFIHIESARILAVFPIPSYSHYLIGDAITRELATKGHDVTVVSPYEDKAPLNNLKNIVLDNIIAQSNEMKSTLYDRVGHNIIQKILWLDTTGLTFTELALNHSAVRKLLREQQHFDLVIYNQFTSDALNGFCHHYKAPCIALYSLYVPVWINRKIGNPGPPSYVAQLGTDYPAEMNFAQRFYNSIVYLLSEISHQFYLYPKQNKLLQKYFPDAPHLDDLYYNTSLILVYSHVSINDVVPSLPNVIQIGGSHIKPLKSLPRDLQDVLDSAQDGAIFFSMGSNLKTTEFPIDKLDAVLAVFSRLKQKVLWKWEEDTLPGKPDNVHISKWFPQQDILAHPNIKLFITHGGMLSTTEAIYHGVPILGIPVFGDQEQNMVRAEQAGYGKYVPFDELSKNTLEEALYEILHNPKYTENAKRRSSIMHDQPLKPLDNAIFWIEYIMRHRGAPHLKSAALNLTWYQYLLLDVVLVAATSIILVAVLIVNVLKMLISLCCSKKITEMRKKKKKH